MSEQNATCEEALGARQRPVNAETGCERCFHGYRPRACPVSSAPAPLGENLLRGTGVGRGAAKVESRRPGHPPARRAPLMMPLAAGSELGDELLGLVQLAVEPVPLLGRALWERLARVARVQLADGGHALPLLGPELPYGRRPLRIAASAFPSRPRESHRSTQYPSRGSRLSGLASPEEWRGSHAYPSPSPRPAPGGRRCRT
jgi:hypothetical protein